VAQSTQPEVSGLRASLPIDWLDCWVSGGRPQDATHPRTMAAPSGSIRVLLPVAAGLGPSTPKSTGRFSSRVHRRVVLLAHKLIFGVRTWKSRIVLAVKSRQTYRRQKAVDDRAGGVATHLLIATL
jgi:hypothetical protein